jgi:aldose 1-epimerase
MQSDVFGTLPSGELVHRYTLAGARGASVEIITFGGIVSALRVPDRDGKVADVVLGLPSLHGYAARHPYFGAIAGRIAGRVSKGEIKVGGATILLERNDGENHLHGGCIGLDRRLWKAGPSVGPEGESVTLSYRSPGGESCYPGNVAISITYTLTATNALVIDTAATADTATPLSLAHHSYFNLDGEGSGSVAGHLARIFAREYDPAGPDMSLTNCRTPVEGTSVDLRNEVRLGTVMPRFYKAHGELYFLRLTSAEPPSAPTLAARIFSPDSGRVLEVLTDESCLQFYTGVALDGTITGKSGRTYGPHAGFCVECQGHPNATCHPALGDILVHPGKPQRRRTVYAFSCQ